MIDMTADQEAERRLIVALDIPDAAQAYDFWQRLAIPNAVCKIGLELLMAGGVDLVKKLASSGVSVFVDAKLFDIGNTVERATARVADISVRRFSRCMPRTGRRSKRLFEGGRGRL